MKKVLRIISLSLFVFIAVNGLKGQGLTKRLNNINIEGLGPAIGYSVNYDRIVPLDSIIKLSVSGGYEFNDESYFLSQFSMLLGRIHHFELGFGYLICSDIKGFGNIASLRIGYRYQNINKRGLVFKFGITPLFYDFGINLLNEFYPGIAIGYNF
jgi:hypothetical protein